MSRIKFCGLFRSEDIEYANRLKPNYIGFILARKGHRQISHEKAARLKRMLDPSIQAVGVFIDEEPEIIAGLVRNGVVDLVQLHGNESNEYIRYLKDMIPEIPLIKAFAIRKEEDVRNALDSEADYILLDSKDSGSGESFAWNWIGRIDRPYFLAGGINEKNIREALGLKPYSLDLSSGIETDRIKDFEKMKRIQVLVKEYENE